VWPAFAGTSYFTASATRRRWEQSRSCSSSVRWPCRASFAPHLLEDNHDIRTVQELLGRGDVSTTVIYIHVLNQGPASVRSPADPMGL